MLAAQGEQMGIGREGILADTAAHYPIGRARELRKRSQLLSSSC